MPNDDSSQPQAQQQMPYYVGVKMIQARPMSRHEFLGTNDPPIVPDSEDQPGYLVRYPDGYESWSPAKAFEEAYFVMPSEEEAKEMAAEAKAILRDE